MSVFHSLDGSTQRQLAEIVGGAAVSTMSVINTRYASGQERFSGSGLLVTDGEKKYVLTANHVLDPTVRTPPIKEAVVKHYHCLDLSKYGEPRRPYALRSKYWKSESLDLAFAESSVSERLDIEGRTDYYPCEKLANPPTFDPFLDDLFVVGGFPDKQRLSIPASNQIQHGMLMHFFEGRDSRQDPDDTSRLRIRYGNSNVSPAGMSGSPIWLIRDTDEPTEPISLERLLSRSGKPYELGVQVFGIVVEYFRDSGEISAVKPDLCAKFAHQALEVMPRLRTPEEDKWINEQLQRH